MENTPKTNVPKAAVKTAVKAGSPAKTENRIENKTENKAENVILTAKARAMNLPVSAKHCIELSRNLRYKTTVEAKKILEGVLSYKKALPFYRFVHNIGHRQGIGSGRYPQKATKEFMHLVKAVEANAQAKGMNITNLKIIKILANRAATPQTGNRHRRGTKRTHLEIEVREKKAFKTERKVREQKNTKK
ncbi:MAG: 50S ribosomal protein L22 [Nanoarchaeota archaeon]